MALSFKNSEATTMAERLSYVMHARWVYGPHLGMSGTSEKHREYVLVAVREVLLLLLPEHEKLARELYGHLEWPQQHRIQGQDFGRPPTFEKLVGKSCMTCGGTGVAGFLTGARCPDC